MSITHLLNAPWAVLPDRLPFISDLLMHGSGCEHFTRCRRPAAGNRRIGASKGLDFKSQPSHVLSSHG